MMRIMLAMILAIGSGGAMAAVSYLPSTPLRVEKESRSQPR